VARLPTPEETILIQKTLSCVARMNGRFGRGRVAQVLAGSRAKEVLDAGLDRLSTYGIMAEQGTDYTWNLLEILISAGCIEVSTGKYPTLVLTPLGDDVMRLRKSIPLALPKPSGPKVTEVKKRKSTAVSSEADAPYDERLFEALKAWRREKAAELGNVPSYLIYSDKTLKDLARRLPDSQAALLDVHGIGPAKAEKFGEETLALIGKRAGRAETGRPAEKS
jgi:ATP-dependent DNA helicase RecQ